MMFALEKIREGLRNDHTGTCRRGPWDGWTLSDVNLIVNLDHGAYRFLEGAWWWSAKA